MFKVATLTTAQESLVKDTPSNRKPFCNGDGSLHELDEVKLSQHMCKEKAKEFWEIIYLLFIY